MTLDFNSTIVILLSVTLSAQCITKLLEYLKYKEMTKWEPSSEAVVAVDAIDDELIRIHEEMEELPTAELNEQRNKLHDTLIEIARRQK